MTASLFARHPDLVEDIINLVVGDDDAVVVDAELQGHAALLVFEPDATEHARRTDTSVGAVRSRGLLHALWALPGGQDWPRSALDQRDVDTLDQEGAGFVAARRDSLTRLYQPAGRVHAVAVGSPRLCEAVGRTAELPPIVRRYAIAIHSTAHDADAARTASSCGIGAALLTSKGLSELTPARAAHTGVPAVYRWWLSEIAYDAWLHTRAH